MNENILSIVMLVGILIIIGLSIYIAVKMKKPSVTTENMSNNYKMVPGSLGFYVKQGGNKQDTDNQDCSNCLTDPDTDTAMYADGKCWDVYDLGYGPAEGSSIATYGKPGQADRDYPQCYNAFSCKAPGKVSTTDHGCPGPAPPGPGPAPPGPRPGPKPDCSKCPQDCSNCPQDCSNCQQDCSNCPCPQQDCSNCSIVCN